MKTIAKLSLLALLPLVVLVGCKDNDGDVAPVSAFDTMTDYMIQSNLDVPDVLSGWIVGAPDDASLADFVDDYYIIDVRSQSDFEQGHIEGAVRTNLVDVLSTAQNANKPILVACYTGQSAGHAVMALRLSGYSDAKVLKFGMSGWHSDLSGPWSGNTGDAAVGHEAWTDGPVAENQTFSKPSFTTNASTGEAILAERVQYMLENGFQGVSNEQVLGDPGSFFINNYWAADDVSTYGHIDGAYRILPLTLAGGQYMNLDPSETVVSYCWTGQTSSMLTAYLTVLGYNAKSLKFGANGMIYSELQGHKYAPPSVDLPVVTD